MSSQLHVQDTYLDSDFDNYAYPVIHADATPTYALPIDARPPKRIRIETQSLTSADSDLPTNQRHQDIDPAYHVVREHVQSQNDPPRDVPEPPKRGRKKKSSKHNRSDPFIHEHMPFPKHQRWLKVRPRQRKAAVEVVEETPVNPPASEAPNDGEGLVLDKHADRIAALIAQKRRDNDSKKFRERMALQQRLHRGEKDGQDRLIAASHDELKRKMELGAQGIFEQAPPDGNEINFRVTRESPYQERGRDGSEDSFSSRESQQDIALTTEMQFDGGLNISFDDHSAEISENSEFDEEYQDYEPTMNAHMESPPPILGPYVHYNQTSYYRHSALTNHTISNPIPTPISRNDGMYTPPSYANHYPNNGGEWAPNQPWTEQMFQALPSTQTPEVERAQMAGNGQHMESYDYMQRNVNARSSYPQVSESYDFYASNPHSVSTTNTSSSSSTPAPGVANMQYQATLPPSFTNNHESEGSIMRSNVNMFTRQARENGVIGGNNNVIIPTTTRRNMFNNRN